MGASSATYFHIARDKLPIGTELRAKGGAHVDDEIEAVLEAARPDGTLARSDAIYMLDHEDFSQCGVPYDEGYVHIVEPIGPVHKVDGNWIGRMQRRKILKKHFELSQSNDASDAELAAGYWSGDASTNKAEWEYLCASARVVGHLSDNAVPTGRKLPSIPGI